MSALIVGDRVTFVRDGSAWNGATGVVESFRTTDSGHAMVDVRFDKPLPVFGDLLDFNYPCPWLVAGAA